MTKLPLAPNQRSLVICTALEIFFLFLNLDYFSQGQCISHSKRNVHFSKILPVIAKNVLLRVEQSSLNCQNSLHKMYVVIRIHYINIIFIQHQIIIDIIELILDGSKHL